MWRIYYSAPVWLLAYWLFDIKTRNSLLQCSSINKWTLLRHICRQSINYSRSFCFNRSYQFSLQCAYSFEIVNVNSAYITNPVHQICSYLGKYLVQNKHTEICKHTVEPYSLYRINSKRFGIINKKMYFLKYKWFIKIFWATVFSVGRVAVPNKQCFIFGLILMHFQIDYNCLVNILYIKKR